MAITFDNAAFGAGGIPTNTVPLTIGGGADRCVLVFVSTSGPSAETVISVCTFDGVAMTPGPTIEEGGGGARVSVFYLLEADLPPAGTYDSVVTVGGGAFRNKTSVISLAGVGGPPEADAAAEVGPSITSSPLAITTVTDDAWIVDIIWCSDANPATPDAAQVERTSDDSDFRYHATSTKATTSAGVNGTEWSSGVGWGGTLRAAVAMPEASTAVTGDGTGALAPFAASGSGLSLDPVTSSGSGALAPFAAAATGLEAMTGATTGALAPFAGAGAGGQGVSGSGTGALASLGALGASLQRFEGVGVAGLAPFGLSALGSSLVAPVDGNGTAALAPFQLEAEGLELQDVVGTGTAALARFRFTTDPGIAGAFLTGAVVTHPALLGVVRVHPAIVGEVLAQVLFTGRVE